MPKKLFNIKFSIANFVYCWKFTNTAQNDFRPYIKGSKIGKFIRYKEKKIKITPLTIYWYGPWPFPNGLVDEVFWDKVVII